MVVGVSFEVVEVVAVSISFCGLLLHFLLFITIVDVLVVVLGGNTC